METEAPALSMYRGLAQSLVFGTIAIAGGYLATTSSIAEKRLGESSVSLFGMTRMFAPFLIEVFSS